MRFRGLVIIAALAALLGGCGQLDARYLEVRLAPDYIRGSAYARAKLLYRAGYLVEARELAEGVSKEDPDYAAARRLTARIDAVLGNIAERHAELGEDYEKGGIYAPARREYEEALRLDPGNRTAGNRLKDLDASPGDGNAPEAQPVPPPAPSPAAKKSRADEKSYQLDDPSFTAAMHYNKGRLFLASGAYNKAIEEFNLVLKYVPGHAEAKKLLEEAKAARETAIEKHLKKGIGYFEAEQMELAIKEWDIVLDLDPENRSALDYRSRAEAILKQLRKIREKQSTRS